MERILPALKATAEPTRLRILGVLREIELTVSELCRVLAQSQPRVSRHLRLLCDAGLLERHAEGTSAFYRLTTDGEARILVETILDLVDPADPQLARDAERLAAVRTERARAAADYFEAIASDWDRLRSLHVADNEVERAILAAA
ncbi:MAG: winged helix-turn-helix transcriptional regulator, partial [Acidimicrobiia bacterium]|nr:winged helix-turn-helix transcriptional regulator [Acidimicrobiia bacterium]